MLTGNNKLASFSKRKLLW